VSFDLSMTAPTAIATEAPQMIHCRIKRQSRGPRLVIRATLTPLRTALKTLALNKNLRTAPPNGRDHGTVRAQLARSALG
jgi:hypothetical protein